MRWGEEREGKVREGERGGRDVAFNLVAGQPEEFVKIKIKYLCS